MGTENKEEVLEVKKTVNEDVDALFSGEELSEEFKTQAKAIFEAAVAAKIEEEKASLEEEFAKKLDEQTSEFASSLVDKIDQYMEYVVENWMEENKVAIERAVKIEMAEDFMVGLKNLFAEHYVDLPEDKADIVEEYAQKVEKLQEELDAAIASRSDLVEQVEQYTKERIASEISEGLSEVQIAKLMSLAEHIEFVSEDDYKEKLQLTKKKYFTVKEEEETVSESKGLDSVENLDEAFSPVMSRYVQSLSKIVKK